MSIDFACKSVDLEEVVKCSLGLTRGEYKVFERALKEGEWFTVSTLAKKMRLDRTTVQKTLGKLLKRGYVERRQFNRDEGGFVFAYKTNKKEEVKKGIKKTVRAWARAVEKEVEEW